MIRIYCDSNIFRCLNPQKRRFNIELLDVFEILKGKMIFTYSDAHLNDLSRSDKNYIETDLSLMGEYVRDNYFMHDYVRDKRTGPYLATPLEAFKGIDYDVYNKTLENPFDIDALLGDLDDLDEGKVIKSMLKKLYDLPTVGFGNIMQPEKMDSQSREWFDKMFPNYNSMMSLGDFTKGIWPFSRALLKDKKELTELRKYIASYMHTDDYGFDKWGMQFNEKLKNSVIGKSFMEIIEGMLTNDQKNNFYQKFNYTYTMLEMYNITQERSSGGIKKYTLESLNTDALHAWYASFSDYLVTNDKGLQVKAHIVYQLLGIPTKVLNLADLINSKSLLLGQEETYEKFLAAFSYDLKNSFQLYSSYDPIRDERVTAYKTSHPYFNYFNRLQELNFGNETSFAFYCDRGSHASFFMYREIESIVNKLIDMLGIDDNNNGRYKFEEREKYQVEENIRSWTKGNLQFTLSTCSKNWGSSICLLMEFQND